MKKINSNKSINEITTATWSLLYHFLVFEMLTNLYLSLFKNFITQYTTTISEAL